MEVIRRISRQEVVAEYPQLVDWLQTHDFAQLRDRERLPSSEEKIVNAGGVDFILEEVRRVDRHLRNQTVILQASRITYMSWFEINRYASTVWQFIGPGTLIYTIRGLEKTGDLNTVQDLLTIWLDPKDEAGELMENTAGSLITPEGGRRILVPAEDRPKIIFAGLRLPSRS